MQIRIIKLNPKNLVKNFGLSAVSVLMFALYLSYLIISEPEHLEGLNFRLFQFFLLLPLFALNTNLLITAYKIKLPFKVGLHTLTILLTVFTLFMIFPSEESKMNAGVAYKIFSLELFLSLAALVVPYLFKSNNNAFWYYIKKIVFRGVIIYAFFGIATIGLCFAFLAIDNLLGLDVSDKIYVNIFNWVGFALPSLFMLGNFPVDFEQVVESDTYPRLLKVLAVYVLIPLVSVYTVILYGYGMKLLVTGEWPENQTVYLILGFVFPGCLGILLLFPHKYFSENSLFNYYRKFFGLSVLPIMAIYFYSIGIRINEYGYTVDRLFVVIFGLWVTLSSGYLMLFTDPKLKNIFGLLAILILAGSFVPYFNIFTLSEKSQFNRLENVLTEEVRDRVVELKSKEYYQATDIIQYLESNHDLNLLKTWFRSEKWLELEDYLDNEPTRYDVGSKVITLLEIKTNVKDDLYSTRGKYIYGQIDKSELFLGGFDHGKLFEFSGYNDQELIITVDNIDYSINFDNADEELMIKGKNSINLNLELKDLILNFDDKSSKFSPEVSTIDYSDGISFKIVITNLNGVLDPTTEDFDFQMLQGIILY